MKHCRYGGMLWVLWDKKEGIDIFDNKGILLSKNGLTLR